MKKLVIELGHGGHDPGAIGKNGTKESDVVLSIGKALNSMLKETNLDFKFTRLSDKYLSLSDRVKLANDFGGDYFLSIHINSCSDDTVRGVECWQYNNSEGININLTPYVTLKVKKYFLKKIMGDMKYGDVF